MFQKESTYLHRKDDDFEAALEAMQHLRKQFLTMPFEEFVNEERLRQTLPAKPGVQRYLKRLEFRLDFGTDSYRYFMPYLRDAKTAEVADMDSSHDVHTDFRGRCDIRNVHTALGYAMGFKYLEEDLAVDRWGYEADPGAVEESISTELGDVQISGYKNAKGHYHGYCQIQQTDGALQRCFFDDGTILARRIYYPNGTSEDIRENAHIAVNPFAQRTVYEMLENHDGDVEVQEIMIDDDLSEKIFHTLGNYDLEMSCVHARRYAYDDDTYYETERDHCIPGLRMALLKDGKLWGVVFKTNGYIILPLGDEKYSLCRRWRTCAIELDGDYAEDALKLSLRKKTTEHES